MSIARLHLFELADQPWFPGFLRTRIQDILTELWTWELPEIQAAPPASLVAHTLRQTLGSDLPRYTFVDLCAGGGGPTPFIEADINQDEDQIEDLKNNGKKEMDYIGRDKGPAPDRPGGRGSVDFILTDLHPHLVAWRKATEASKSQQLRYVPTSIDATSASKRQILDLAEPSLSSKIPQRPTRGPARDRPETTQNEERRVFRLFNLSFHHFDDELADKILQSTLESSEGFGIFELQGRDWGSIFMALLMWPILVLGSYGWYWGEWTDFFLHGVVPIIPTIIVFDAVVSCLRTRTNTELELLVKSASKSCRDGLQGWQFVAGEELHTWPLGKMRYFIGRKH